MGLGGFIVGGALAGAGKGLAMQAEQSALERREARLQAARAAERQEDRKWDQEDAAQKNTGDAEGDQRKSNFKIAEITATATAETNAAKVVAGIKPFAEDYDKTTKEAIYRYIDPKAPGGVREERFKVDRSGPKEPEKPSVVGGVQRDAEGNAVVFVEQNGRVTPQRPGVKLSDDEAGKPKVVKTETNWRGIRYREYSDGTTRTLDGKTVPGDFDPRPYKELPPADRRYADRYLEDIRSGKDRTQAGVRPKASQPQQKSPDQTPVTEGGYKYTPGPGGRANQANWSKA